MEEMMKFDKYFAQHLLAIQYHTVNDQAFITVDIYALDQRFTQ
jgi:hypothetical protein